MTPAINRRAQHDWRLVSRMKAALFGVGCMALLRRAPKAATLPPISDG
jgi:hypothetical protein